MAKKIGRRENPRGGDKTIVWIGGMHAVSETLRARPASVGELWVVNGVQSPEVGEMIRLARKAGARVLFVGRGELDRATGGGHNQGVGAKTYVAASEAEDFSTFLARLSAEQKKGMVLVALDQIQDPHNLGAIARSAVNLGARGLIVPERRSAPVSPAAIQASAGAIQKIDVFRVVNLAQALARCKEHGFWIYGADASGPTAWSAKINTPLVLVIGSEGYGMRDLVRASCDGLLSIPQTARGVSSLNASCAASVLLYEIARQRASSP